MTAWLERHQIVLYLVAILAGFAAGGSVPAAEGLEVGINPAIAVLLFATFLGVPFTRLGAAFRDVRFLLTLLALNFVAVPAVVWGLSRFIAQDEALMIGVLLVLLTPCIDYVIVFSALAGAAHEKLLAAAPLLMIAQLVLLPVYFLVFVGPATLDIIQVGPFLDAFLILIVVPLLVAAVTQWAAPRVVMFRAAAAYGATAMVPLMMLVLFLVVASHARRIIDNAGVLVGLVPVYAGFLLVMGAIGVLVSRLARLDVGSARALVFSGATRNSLVVLPLALALPPALAVVPAVVVMQTLVELIGMVAAVRVVPLLVPDRGRPPEPAPDRRAPEPV